ncbi:MAG: hypothetical protein OXB88_07405 [Bacteriovoracales bacterium]|nr:hypothetical protein [Bacteriovoracales bacterium]
MIPIVLLSISLMGLVGCKSKGGSGGGRGGPFMADRPWTNDPVRIAELRRRLLDSDSFASSHNASINIEHFGSSPTLDRCRFLGIKKIKFDCWKSKAERKRRWQRSQGSVNLSGHFGSTSIENDSPEEYQKRIKQFLHHNVFYDQNITIEEISLNSLPSPLSNHVLILSNLTRGRERQGRAIKVTRREIENEGGNGEWKVVQRSFIFSFDVPVEANPIYEGVVERKSQDQNVQRYNETYLNGNRLSVSH